MNDSQRDLMLGEIHADVRTLLKTSGEHGSRLTKLEDTHHRTKGAITVIMTGVSALWAILLAFFEYMHRSSH